MAKKRKPGTSAFPPALFPYIQQTNDDTLTALHRHDADDHYPLRAFR